MTLAAPQGLRPGITRVPSLGRVTATGGAERGFPDSRSRAKAPKLQTHDMNAEPRAARPRTRGRRKRMAFEFGMFHEFQRTAGVTDEEAFATSFEQVDAAERWGLDAMWLAEIHVAPERSVCSAPLTLASAIAARTTRMKIGTAVQVLPRCHPLRLAEEVATVDQISQGRLIFGVGRSGVVSTYDAYQVPYDESRERFTEILDIVKRAWTEPRFSYAGKYHSLDDVACVPRPYQKPLPEIRVAASTPDTFPAIGS